MVSGHTISNGKIQTDTGAPTTRLAYGFFGSIGGGDTYALIQNVEFDGIDIYINHNGNLSNSSGGIHVGTVTGKLYNHSKILNVIVKNGTITDVSSMQLRTNSFQIFVGGIAGFATNTTSSESDPGVGERYAIENCYSDVDIDLDVTLRNNSRQYMGQFAAGGIIGAIRSQPVWPTNCLYTGTLNSTYSYCGPIFGCLRGSSSYSTTSDFQYIWYGNDVSDLTMDSYYSDYSVNSREFTSTYTTGNTPNTTTYRRTTTTTNVGNIQGMNKGIYTPDISTMEDDFNAYAGTTYSNWICSNNSYDLVPALTAGITANTATNTYTVVTNNSGSNTYEWYVNDTLTNNNTASIVQAASWTTDYKLDVIVKNGSYYAMAEHIVPKLYIDISFNINAGTNTVAATLGGTAISYANLADYTYKWYKLDNSGMEVIEIPNSNSLVLTGIEPGEEYRLVATNTTDARLSAEDSVVYGTRKVIYISENDGSNTNDGLTPQTPVRSMSTAYGKLEGTGTVKTNIIVVMGDYVTTDYLTSATATTYDQKVTLTGAYGGVNYNGAIILRDDKFLVEDTTFKYLKFYGYATTQGTGQAFLYAQGHDLTMGNGIYMQRYNTSNQTSYALADNRAPDFHIVGAFLNNNRTSIPTDNNNATITIQSGTYARVIAGTRNTTENTTSHNITGNSTDLFNIRIIVDIQNSTTPSTSINDISMLVGGQTDGSIYANTRIEIKNGVIGRILGGSIGVNRQISNNPSNTFIGSSSITVTGGTIGELYGASLGRQRSDVYFYGPITIDIQGGTITQNIFGAGGGGTTGYSTITTDPYKSVGEGTSSNVNITISGGEIYGNVYGAGYGYSAYLDASTIASDGGTLYGNTNVTITGGNIHESVYGAGKGYSGYSGKTALAQVYGNTNVNVSGNATILGNIYGSGEGISGYENMAKLTGTATVNISKNTTTNIYGGGSVSKTEGNTVVKLRTGNVTGTIYGGGHQGIVTGKATVELINGSAVNVYGGGESAATGYTEVRLQGSDITTIYCGSDSLGDISSTLFNGTGGEVDTLYGANRAGGYVATSTLAINGCKIKETVYGGGEQADVGTATITATSANGTIKAIYGGGQSADAHSTVINLNGATVTESYGGSYTNGLVQNTRVNINAGQLGTVYGGNNAGGRTVATNVYMYNGVPGIIYGGGKKAPTATSNIYLLSGVAADVYGGGSEAAVDTTNITGSGGTANNIFGGSNTLGDVTVSNITITSGSIGTVYGGNNAGGRTVNSNVRIEGGTISYAYGGGRQAQVTTSNVYISGNITHSAFGGGDAAEVSGNSNLQVVNGTIGENVYGGGNEGEVKLNTTVRLSNATVGGSAYAGGNGVTAIVTGNTTITCDGTTVVGTNTSVSPTSGCVFGGGNAAATGIENVDTSTGTVNIAGATIYGNVYGGANTSRVYGATDLNIGYDAVADNTLTKGNVFIKGTIFGGGEANASGSDSYDFEFISVTRGIEINIDGTGHTLFKTTGSIFGSGNASSARGISNIYIKNFGTVQNPQQNVSIQRANTVVLDNSAMVLKGAKDTTNEFSNTFFSISRVTNLKLKNGGCVYLNYGANLLYRLDSLVDINGQEVAAAVDIDEDTGDTTANVINRIYMCEGRNLNVATNQYNTAYGEVHGMTFFGLFTNTTNPSTSAGFYNCTFDNGDEITNAGTFSSNSYVSAQHAANHDLHVDGFFTNYDEDGYIKTGYVGATPENDVYYIWLVGKEMEVQSYDIPLSASKYATLGTFELPLNNYSTPNTKFIISGISSGLNDDISLVHETAIDPIASTDTEANSVFGLSMRVGKNGWSSNSRTDFYTANGATYSGSTMYIKDNSIHAESLIFCLYHSQNLTQAQSLGTFRIRLQVLTPVDELNYEISYIDLNVIMITELFQASYYEAAISPGEEFNLFTTTETNITDSSIFSTYYSLLITDFDESDYYADYDTYHRVLVSRDSQSQPYVYKANTKLVMMDMATNSYYYYVVTQADEQANKYKYYLRDFIKMGSTNEYFNEQAAQETYFNNSQNLIYENFIFHVDFEEANITNTSLDNTLLIELQSQDNQTLIGVLGIQRTTAKYSVYVDQDSTIDVTETLDTNTLYLGKTLNMTVTTEFTQPIINSKTIFDTKYFDDQMGVKISIYDSNNNQLGVDSLLGVSFTIAGQTYYPRVDGTVRINVADRVSNSLLRIAVNTANNTSLATGTYTIKVESFGSADGIYYGLQASDIDQKQITIINSSYGLKVETDNNSKVIDKITGHTLNGSNSLVSNISYSSGLTNPKIYVALERRSYASVYALAYEKVDLADYVSSALTDSTVEDEYVVSTSPVGNFMHFLTTGENLVTGTYRLVYKLYDGNTYIGNAYEYFVIK